MYFHSVTFFYQSTYYQSYQSPAAATQRTADQSPASVITRRTSDQSSKSTAPPTVTLLQNTKKWKQSLMIKGKTKREKGQCSIQQEQHKPEKEQCPARRRQNKGEKKKYNRGMEIEG